MLANCDEAAPMQLRDCLRNATKQKSKQVISEMFSAELRFIVDCLNGYFDIITTGKCTIFKLPLDLTINKVEQKKLIKKDHKFLRNIFEKEETERS